MVTVATDLIAAFSGEVLQPDDAGYDAARKVHNGLIDKRPALIARCRNTADVVDALAFARAAGLEVAVRGGGHNVAGKATTDGGVMIDLAQMRGVHVDPDNRTVRAQGGVTWRDYNRTAHAFGLATTGGVISTTGVAGLTLGGGLGWLMGSRGLSIDNLVSAEIVLASGEIVTASEDGDADLFWAIRGGGGNFGVATSLEFRAHPLTTVLGGLLAHPLEAAPEVLGFYRQFTKAVPDELTAFAALVYAPDGSGMKLCAVPMCHAGDEAQAERDARPLRDFGPPAMDLVDRMPYPAINAMLDDGYPAGALNYWKSAFLEEISDDAVSTMVAAFEKAPTQMCGLFIEHFHGAVTRVSPTATAFPHREEGYNFLVAGLWSDPAQTDECIAWTRGTFDAMHPFMADRNYMNYMDADESERVRSAYGPNYERLVSLKTRYDPDNVFRLNQNIA